MADVKWIKISTSIFDDEKIRLIESMPDRDTILIIWLKILAQAGKCNASGHLILSQSIPYTEEMLSTIFDRPISTIRLALSTFQQFGMIDTSENVFHVSNWQKHQNIEGLDKIREQNRIRKQNQRDKEKEEQKLLSDNFKDVTRQSRDITQQNKSKNKNKSIDIKSKYGEYAHVLLTNEEFLKLSAEYQNADELIKFLDEYIEMKGYKAKNHYLCLKKWVADAVTERKGKKTGEAKDNVFTEIGRDMGIW